MVTTSLPLLSPVDVWCASTSRWVPGFRIAEVRPDGLVVLLGRDGGPRLPEAFPPEYLRPTDLAPRTGWSALSPA
jgi:hypothetical protein